MLNILCVKIKTNTELVAVECLETKNVRILMSDKRDQMKTFILFGLFYQT